VKFKVGRLMKERLLGAGQAAATGS